MIVHKDPGVDEAFSLNDVLAQSFQKQCFVPVIFENVGLIDPAHHDVMQCAGGVKASLAWHEAILCVLLSLVKSYALNASTSPRGSLKIGKNMTWEDSTVEICGGVCDSPDLCKIESCEFYNITQSGTARFMKAAGREHTLEGFRERLATA